MKEDETGRIWPVFVASVRKWQLAAVMLLVVSVPLHAEEPLSTAAAVTEEVVALPDQLGTLPDPQLSLILMNLPVDSLSFSQEGRCLGKICG